MKTLLQASVPKDPFFPDENEDILICHPLKNRIAMSDGASESFDSSTWAKILCTKFIHSPKLDITWIEDAIGEYYSKFDVDSLSWSKRYAFERGSFATLLGIEYFANDNVLKMFGVGDSIAILLDNNLPLISFPHSHSSTLTNHPELFSTKNELNTFITSLNFPNDYSKIIELDSVSNPILLCMTDAMGEWVLRNYESDNAPWNLLYSVRDQADFEEFIYQERSVENIQIDDCTLAIINLSL